jgi:hypothetical protein
MSELWHGLRRWRWTAAGIAAVVFFAVLAGRFWHPYYGFTKFIQLDEADARSGIHEIRENPVFAYDGFNGYDGAAYAQLAFHPLLDSPELQPALGNVPYRARRILGSALAWLLAAGNPARIAGTYAALNVTVWLLLAVLLWRALAVSDARSWVGWAGVMFSAGALHSVRLALTDLLAATLVLAGMLWAEQGRTRGAMGWLAVAGLARETALAAVVGLWRGPWRSPGGWPRNTLRTIGVALPLLAWIIYVHLKAGPAAQGFGNFTWPVVGWVEKWLSTLRDFARQPDFRWLNTTTLLAVVALTTQAAYFLARARWADAWWRVGAAGVAMMVLLGTSVWEGHPGAATRVLLPMHVAFAVLAVRSGARWPWLAGGSLSVCSGVLALWHVPESPREVAAGTYHQGGYVMEIGPGWHGVERAGRSVWAWAPQTGELRLKATGGFDRATQVRLKLRALTPRSIEVRDDGRVVWQGSIGERPEWVQFPVVPTAGGGPRAEVRLTVASAMPGARENEHPDARVLGFAVYGATVE